MFPPAALDATRWTGSAELWLDPLGDVASHSDATISITGTAVDYTWTYEGAPVSSSCR